jgi:hypothetical protein
VVRGLGDVLLSIAPAGSVSNTSSKKDLKKGRELSTSGGNGKPPAGLPFNRNLVRMAGISGAIAVGLGAYGAHGKCKLM